MREQGLSASRLVEPRLQVALPSGKRSYKTCGRKWTGGGAVKTVHPVPAGRQPARRRLLGASRLGKVFVYRSMYRLRIIRRYITVYHQTIQPARATEHTVWYFGFVPIRPPAAARVRSTPPTFYGTARARSRGVDRCGASPQQPHTHGML